MNPNSAWCDFVVVEQADVADQFSGVLAFDSEDEAVGVGVENGLLHAPVEHLFGLFMGLLGPVEIAHHVGSAVDVVQLIEITVLVKAEEEAVGVDGVGRLAHARIVRVGAIMMAPGLFAYLARYL